MTTDPTPRRYTVDEYLRLEADSRDKHEFREGRILAMAGASYEHTVITSNLIRIVGNQLAGKPCRVSDSNLRVAVERDVRYSYPDLAIVCGEPRFDPRDPTGMTVMNPRVVFEVLSPSTEASDRGEKFQRYMKITSLQEYVLVAQVQPRVEAFYRQPDGTWSLTFADGLDATMKLRSSAMALPLADVYAGIGFPAE